MSDDRLRTGAGRILLDLLHVISPGAHYSDSIRAIEDEAWMRAEEARATDTAPGPWNRPPDSPELRDCTLCRIGTPIDPRSPLWPEDHIHLATDKATAAPGLDLDLIERIEAKYPTRPKGWAGQARARQGHLRSREGAHR